MNCQKKKHKEIIDPSKRLSSKIFCINLLLCTLVEVKRVLLIHNARIFTFWSAIEGPLVMNVSTPVIV